MAKEWYIQNDIAMIYIIAALYFLDTKSFRFF